MDQAPPIKRRPTTPASTLKRRATLHRANAARKAKEQEQGRPMSERRKRFVEAFTGEANGNKTEAARIAGFAQPEFEGMRLTKDDKVVQAIASRVEAEAMGSTECLTRIAELGRADIGEFADLVGATDEGHIRSTLKRLHAQGKTRVIKRLTPTRYGLSVELGDSQGARETIAKYLGLLRDRLEIDVRPPSYDTAKIRALLADPRGMELVCELDARLAAIDGAPLACEPSDGSSDLPALEGPSQAPTGASAPNPPVGADD
jgi:hypothetical protein